MAQSGVGGESPVQVNKWANVTFSYTSPSKKKSLSSDARFTTKNFKQRHFPQLELREDDSLQKVVKNGKKSQFDYQIYTEKEAPKQPKILKMNKMKSKQKLEITLSPKNSEKEFRKSEK